jgi:hypothetical protein
LLGDPFFSLIGTAGWTLPNGAVLGVTIDSPEMQTLPNNYASAFATNLTGYTFPVNMGMDLYDFEASQQAIYTGAINTFQNAGHSVFVEEFGPQAWVNDSMTSGQPCAIVGLQSCTWNTLNQNFFAALLPSLASLGVTDASLYGTEMLGACAPVYPDNGQNTTALANATSAMVSKQYSMACSRMASLLSQWNMTSLTGGTLMRGSLIP